MERHDLLEMMGELQLSGMKAAFDEVLRDALRCGHTIQRVLADLLKAEMAEKRARSIRYRLAAAKLPLVKELAEFDFTASPVNAALVRDLHGGGLLKPPRNAVLVGGTGTGKSHLALCIAVNCIRGGARVRFFNVVDLVNQLEAEARAGQAGKLAGQLARLDLVVLDELGYLPFAQSGGQLLFHLLRHRSTKGEGESSSLRIRSCDCAPSRSGWAGGASGWTQAASRRGLCGRRGGGRLTSAGRRAEHGARG